MSNQLTLPVQAGSLPTGFCPQSFQDILNAFTQQQTVIFPTTFAGVTVSATKPIDTTQGWLQLDSLGRPTRFYYFAQGAWLSLHPEIPGMTKIWTGPAPDYTTFDGGDANAAGAASGPMWQTVLSAVFPIGAGTLASGKVIAVGATGGEENHTLITKELPSHNHQYGLDPQSNVAQNYLAFGGFGRFADAVNAAAGNFYNTAPYVANSVTGSTGGDSTNANATVSHNNMPPYQVVTFIQRTNRLFYVVN